MTPRLLPSPTSMLILDRLSRKSEFSKKVVFVLVSWVHEYKILLSFTHPDDDVGECHQYQQHRDDDEEYDEIIALRSYTFCTL